MGLINIIKSLSTFLLPALPVNLSNIERNFWERREWNLEQLGEKRQYYLCAMQGLCCYHHRHQSNLNWYATMYTLIIRIHSILAVWPQNYEHL